MNWMNCSIFLALLLALPFAARAADETETKCRARLKNLGGAVTAYKLLHEDKLPAKLSDLYRDGLVENFSDFVCPSSGVTIAAVSDIDEKSDYTLESLSDAKDLLVREKKPSHGDSVLAIFKDGSIKPVRVAATTGISPPVTPPTNPATTTAVVPPVNPPVTPPPTVTPPVTPPTVTPPPAGGEPAEFARAHEHYAAGRFADALPLYNAAIRSSPNHAPSLFERAVVRMWTNDLRGALEDATAAQKLTQDVETRRLKTGIEIVAGDPRVALQEAEVLLKAQPDNAMMHILHGEACLWNNNADAAQQSFKRAAQLAPDLAQGLYNQAIQFYNAGVFAMALQQFLAVQGVDPNHAGAYYGLGLTYSKLGQTEHAIRALQTYLQMDKTSPHAAAAREELRRLQGR